MRTIHRVQLHHGEKDRMTNPDFYWVTPRAELGQQVLGEALFSLFKTATVDDLVSFLTNKFSATVEYQQLCLGKDTCQKISLLFNPHRLCCNGKSRAPVFPSLKEQYYCDGLARALLFKRTTKDPLYQAIQMGFNSIQYCNDFPPKVARDLCLEFGISLNSRALDPCAGWGGRMIGISTVCNNYHGWEPASKTFHGLLKLRDFLRKFRPGFNPDIQCLPFEDAEIKKDCYDFAITSPPYYDTEVYSEEETNSLNRYKTFEDWCDAFFIPMIKKTIDALKRGKIFVLNIGSRRYPLSSVLYSSQIKGINIVKGPNWLSNSGLGRKEKEGESFYYIKKL